MGSRPSLVLWKRPLGGHRGLNWTRIRVTLITLEVNDDFLSWMTEEWLMYCRFSVVRNAALPSHMISMSSLAVVLAHVVCWDLKVYRIGYALVQRKKCAETGQRLKDRLGKGVWRLRKEEICFAPSQRTENFYARNSPDAQTWQV